MYVSASTSPTHHTRNAIHSHHLKLVQIRKNKQQSGPFATNGRDPSLSTCHTDQLQTEEMKSTTWIKLI
jgi:hypothetical protein